MHCGVPAGSAPTELTDDEVTRVVTVLRATPGRPYGACWQTCEALYPESPDGSRRVLDVPRAGRVVEAVGATTFGS